MRTLTLLATFGAAAALVTTLEAQNPNPWTWHGAVASGRSLEVRGISGAIRAERGSGNEVEITARKTAEESDVNEVHFAVVQAGGDVTVCAVYPGGSDDCTSGDERPRRHTHSDVSVAFTVRVPAGVAFRGVMVSGDVTATGLDGRVTLSSVSGDVTASGLTGRVSVNSVSGDAELETTAGDATATSVSGDVVVTLRGRGDTPLRFSSVSGDITLNLPANTGADVELTTVSGELTTDFPLTVTRGIGHRRLAGQINGGGRALELHTVSGDVRIRRLP